MPDLPEPREDELIIVELDDRLEFGAVIMDSDLNADVNSGCVNGGDCVNGSNVSCTNHGC